MTRAPREELTDLLAQWRDGSESALERLLPVVYDELRTLAQSHLRRERRGHTVHTGTLVHQVFVRLVEGKPVPWEGRAHFFGVAARLMRQILVDHARARDADKRGSGEPVRPITDALSVAVQAMDVGVIALDRALVQLSQLDSQQAKVVELRFFGGLTVEETAEALGISTGTVKRELSMARAWLRRTLSGDAGL